MNLEIETIPEKVKTLMWALDLWKTWKAVMESGKILPPKDDEMTPSHVLFTYFPSPGSVHSSHSRAK